MLKQIAKEIFEEALKEAAKSGVAQKFTDSKAKKPKPAVLDKGRGKTAKKQFAAKIDRAKPNIKVKSKKIAETKKK